MILNSMGKLLFFYWGIKELKEVLEIKLNSSHLSSYFHNSGYYSLLDAAGDTAEDYGIIKY